MASILSLLLILILSVLMTRIATVILVHTGLSREMARFQARSAFSGAGFTTSESEKIVNHPLRRRVVSTLILLCNAGVVTAIASLLLTFLGKDQLMPDWLQFSLLGIGIAGVWFVANSKLLDRWLSAFISRVLAKHTPLNVVDVDSLLHLEDGYRISELAIPSNDDWLADRTIAETRLREEGMSILAIRREDGSFIGNPTPHSRLEVGDTVICYGLAEGLTELEQRRRNRSGDRAHGEQVDRERLRRREQERQQGRRRLERTRRSRHQNAATKAESSEQR